MKDLQRLTDRISDRLLGSETVPGSIDCSALADAELYDMIGVSQDDLDAIDLDAERQRLIADPIVYTERAKAEPDRVKSALIVRTMGQLLSLGSRERDHALTVAAEGCLRAML